MHTLDDGKVYVISVLENYSRAILASALSRRQDLSAYLMVLYAAIRQHGAPEALVSDSGGIFLAKQAKQVYTALGIRKEEIARRQPWQSLIEANFGVQARMADWDFRKATTWADLLTVHEQWVANFNYQVHWAHQRRQDGRQTPEAVLNRMSGRPFTPEALHRAFYTTRFGRTIDKVGYVRFRHWPGALWAAYGERGLPGRQVAVWLYREHLTVAFADEPLAEYQVRYEPGTQRLKAITDPHLFETPFAPAQLPLLTLGEEDWLKVLRVPPYAPRRQRATGVSQPPLFSLGGA